MEKQRKLVIVVMTCSLVAVVWLVVTISNLIVEQNYEKLEQACLLEAKTLNATGNQTYDKQIIIELLNSPVECNGETVVLPKAYTEALTMYLNTSQIKLSEEQIRMIVNRYQDIMQFYSHNELPLEEWTREDQNWFLYLVNEGLIALKLKGIYTSENLDFAIVKEDNTVLVGNKVLTQAKSVHWTYVGIGIAALIICYLIYFIITIRENRRSIINNKTIGREVYGE